MVLVNVGREQEDRMRQALYGVGMIVVLASLATPLSAGRVIPVPEIDGGSISAGLGLLAGGILMLRARWGARKH
jgi:hypothetical protein